MELDVRQLLLEPDRSLASMSPGLRHSLHQPTKQGTVFTHGDGCQIRCPEPWAVHSDAARAAGLELGIYFIRGYADKIS